MMLVAVSAAVISSYAGLLLSYRADLPSGPAIILVGGAIYLFSVAFGPFNRQIWLVWPRRHLEA